MSYSTSPLVSRHLSTVSGQESRIERRLGLGHVAMSRSLVDKITDFM